MAWSPLGTALVTTPNNVIVCNKEGDFLTQDATTITLTTGKEWFIGSFISTTKRFIVEEGAVLRSIGFLGVVFLEYTGVDAMFSSNNASWTMNNIRFTCPNGSVVDKTGTGTLFWDGFACVECESIGSYVGGGATPPNGYQWETGIFFNIKTSGLRVTGNLTLLSFTKTFMVTSTVGLSLINWTGAIIDNLELTNIEARGPVGSFVLEGDAGGANLPTGIIASIASSTFGLPGTMTALTGGLLNGDPAYEYRNVTGLEDSKILAYAFVTTPALTDVLDGVDVQVAGTFSEGIETSQAVVSADGTIEMENIKETLGFAEANIDVSKAGGAAHTYTIKVKKDPGGVGSPVDVNGVFASITLAGGGSSNITVSGPVRHIAGDKFFVSIRGVGTDEDVTATTEGLSITG